jgi:hypothetical protein
LPRSADRWPSSSDWNRLSIRLDKEEEEEERDVVSPHFFSPLTSLPALTALQTMPVPSVAAICIIRRIASLRGLVFESGGTLTEEHLESLLAGDDPIPPLEALPERTMIDAATVDLRCTLDRTSPFPSSPAFGRCRT